MSMWRQTTLRRLRSIAHGPGRSRRREHPILSRVESSASVVSSRSRLAPPSCSKLAEARPPELPVGLPVETKCSHNPPELARLVVRCLPGRSQERMVIGSRAAFENQLRRIGRLGVGKEAKRPDYNLVPIDVRNQQGSKIQRGLARCNRRRVSGSGTCFHAER
jgi:hypothetical protein